MIDEKEILNTISKYKFYHNIKLTDTNTTPGWAAPVPIQNLCMKHLESMKLQGTRVLDIGCRDGLFSLKAESMGAHKVIGIDNDLSKPATEFILPFLNSRIEMIELNLYDLNPKLFGLFDIVIFAGVLYHLRYPFWALKVIRDVLEVGGTLLIETAIWQGEADKAMLFCPIDSEGPYQDPTSCTFFNEKGLIDTMKSLGFETTRVEYLNKTEDAVDAQPLTKRAKHKMKQVIKNALKRKGFTRSSLETDRCVLQSVYHGHDPASKFFVRSTDAIGSPTEKLVDVQSNTKKYWEGTHDIHTKFG